MPGLSVRAAARATFLAAEARRLDPERFAIAVLSPPAAREAVMALVVLNQELARAGDGRAEPMAGLIRLQWWRDAVTEAQAGRPCAQPVLEALAAPLADRRLSVDLLEPMIGCRERALEGWRAEDMAALESYLGDGSGRLQEAIARILNVSGDDPARRARRSGTAFALVGLGRAVALREAAALALLPHDVRNPADAIETLVGRSEALIAEVRRQGPHAAALVPALLPLRLAAIGARRLRRAGFDRADPRVARRSPWTAAALAIASLTRRP